MHAESAFRHSHLVKLGLGRRKSLELHIITASCTGLQINLVLAPFGRAQFTAYVGSLRHMANRTRLQQRGRSWWVVQLNWLLS